MAFSRVPGDLTPFTRCLKLQVPLAHNLNTLKNRTQGFRVSFTVISAIKTVIESNEDVAFPKDVNALENAYKALYDSLSLLSLASDLINSNTLLQCIKDLHSDRLNNKDYVLNLLKVRGQACPNETSINNEIVSLLIKRISSLGGSDITLCEYIIEFETAHAEQILSASMAAGSTKVNSILSELAKGLEISCVSLSESLAVYKLNNNSE
jgi:hypothetical protein